MIDYSPLWRTMEARGVSQQDLLKNGLTRKTLGSLQKNKVVAMRTIENLCKLLRCNFGDVLVFVSDKPKE